MLAGVYRAVRKDGMVYYRSSITYQNKHISLGSFTSELGAHEAYLEAYELLSGPDISLEQKLFGASALKFEIDDLFFYSTHKILKRGGHLFVNEYGMQTSILSRYGIKNFAVAGKDYIFMNGDTMDFRYSNIMVINRYYGVTAAVRKGQPCYEVRIHINGNFLVGVFRQETTAAIAYNKAVDLAAAHGVLKNFSENYIPDMSAKEYAEIYSELKLSKKFLHYLESL